MMKNGVHFIMIAISAAKPFKIPTYANQMTRDIILWTQSGVKSQKIEYLSQLFLYRVKSWCSCYTYHKVP